MNDRTDTALTGPRLTEIAHDVLDAHFGSAFQQTCRTAAAQIAGRILAALKPAGEVVDNPDCGAMDIDELGDFVEAHRTRPAPTSDAVRDVVAKAIITTNREGVWSMKAKPSPYEAELIRAVLAALSADRTTIEAAALEAIQINRADVEGNRRDWPEWMRGVTIGGFREQGWNAYFGKGGRVIASGDWGEYLRRDEIRALKGQQPERTCPHGSTGPCSVCGDMG